MAVSRRNPPAFRDFVGFLPSEKALDMVLLRDDDPGDALRGDVWEFASVEEEG